MVFLCVCKHTMYGPDICRGQMGALGPPGLELQLIVGHHVSAEGWEGNLSLDPPYQQHTLLPPEPRLQSLSWSS